MATQEEQVNACLAVIRVISETVQEFGEVPSGHIYAGLMGKVSLDQYNLFVDVLKRSGKITEDSFHLLHWVG